MSIRPPVSVPTWLIELQDTAPEIIDQLQGLHHDAPFDYRSTDERRKNPLRPDTPLTEISFTWVNTGPPPPSLAGMTVTVLDRDPGPTDFGEPGDQWLNSTTGDFWVFR